MEKEPLSVKLWSQEAFCSSGTIGCSFKISESGEEKRGPMAQPEQALVVTQRNGTGFITLLTALLRN
jgi:hypothetical protein